jgi:hypothetical protein
LLSDRPQRKPHEDEDEYLMRYAQFVMTERSAQLRIVDAKPSAPSTIVPKIIDNTINAKAKARAKTMADFLADNPALIALQKEGFI